MGHRLVAAAALLVAVLPLVSCRGAVGEEAVLEADRSLMRAIEEGDRQTLDQLTDPDFTWINRDGILLAKEQVLRATPELLLGSASGAELRTRGYGSQLQVIQYHRGDTHAMHIWAQRPAGWRLMHLVELVETARVAYGGTTVGGECVNPCQSVPFLPTSPVEAAVMAAWQDQQSGPESWTRRVPDDNISYSSNGTRTKADRLAVIAEQQRSGAKVASAPLLWARIWEFNDAAIMLALQPANTGKPYWGSRVFVNRDGYWQMSESFQTNIAGASPMTVTGHP